MHAADLAGHLRVRTRANLGSEIAEVQRQRLIILVVRDDGISAVFDRHFFLLQLSLSFFLRLFRRLFLSGAFLRALRKRRSRVSCHCYSLSIFGLQVLVGLRGGRRRVNRRSQLKISVRFRDLLRDHTRVPRKTQIDSAHYKNTCCTSHCS